MSNTRVPRPDESLPEVPPLPESAGKVTDDTLAGRVEVVAEVLHEPSADAPAAEIAAAQEVHLAHTESREARIQRWSTGVLVGLVAIVMVRLIFATQGSARFALSDAFAAKKLPELSFAGVPIVVISAVVLALAATSYFVRPLPHWVRVVSGSAAGLALVLGFLAWAAAGRALPFQVSNQLAGTLVFATPLVFGALAGVLCERSGVVNVAIEGQMLTAAFTGTLVSAATKSVLAGMIGAIFAGVLMAAMLALFTIKYLVDQVVIGVVINLFASGITSFLFKAIVDKQPKLNEAPLMQAIPIKGLSWIPALERIEWLDAIAPYKLPFFGQILFNQTILVYLAVVSVVLVWFGLYRTKWGLRVRAVGEHPKAADTVGINVIGIRWSAVLAGGVFAGLGGSFFPGATGLFNDDITVGNGFIALAAVIMGRWKPVTAAIMALFFGFVQQLGSQVQTLGTPINSQWLLLLPYAATIVAVAGLVGRVRAPAADGVPYTKS